MDDLVKREGTYYKNFTDVPFTGTTTGREQATFKNGKYDGPWVSYYENGQLSYKGDYKNGEREGPWVDYYKDGTVHENLTGTYRNGVKVD